MSQFLKNHSIKIAISTLVGIVAAIISFGVLIGEAKSEIKKIPVIEKEVKKIPVLENNVITIKDDIKEIKADVKLLINRK
jgi:hypothetical protein